MPVDDDLIRLQTEGIAVSAGQVLVEEENLENQYMWGYYFCFENNTKDKIRLVGKNWNITDEKGNSYHDSSAGFKGELPELEPGEVFEYTSYAPLKAANAVFYGSCLVEALGQNKLKNIKMPTFSLSAAGKAKKRVLN